MDSKKESLNRGVVFVASAVPFLFIGPTVIHFAFINQQQPLYWAMLILGLAICIGGVILAFKGLLKITNSLF